MTIAVCDVRIIRLNTEKSAVITYRRCMKKRTHFIAGKIFIRNRFVRYFWRTQGDNQPLSRLLTVAAADGGFGGDLLSQIYTELCSNNTANKWKLQLESSRLEFLRLCRDKHVAASIACKLSLTLIHNIFGDEAVASFS